MALCCRFFCAILIFLAPMAQNRVLGRSLLVTKANHFWFWQGKGYILENCTSNTMFFFININLLKENKCHVGRGFLLSFFCQQHL
jgi:hypothetical protein